LIINELDSLEENFLEEEIAMFAVLQTGGKQYRVEENSVIRVEKLDGEAGEVLSFDQVLMVGKGGKITVGAPIVVGAKVEATVVRQMRDRKVIIFKKIRRHNHRRKKGHRQSLTVLKIKTIIA
jgi:large subunit ribosomal protein L21